MKPILLDLWGFQLFAYPLMMGIAWGIGYYGTLNQLEKRNLNTKGFGKLFLGVFITAWLGAKLFFLINSSHGHVHEYSINSNFWLGGGFVFYGGLIFGISYVLIYCLLFKKFEIKNLYLSLPSLSFAHGVGRIGCFLAGCCYGNQCKLPWAISLHNQLRHPVQLYEVICLFILGFILNKMIEQKNNLWLTLNTYIASYAVIRFFLEFYRGDKIRGEYLLGLSSSQFISVLILLVLFITNIFRSMNIVKKQ